MSKPTTGLRRAGIASVATSALALSALVAGAGAANADADFAFERAAGDNRYATSAEIAGRFGDSTEVILASGEDGHFPDALTGNFLAGEQTAPILLTRFDRTPQVVLDAIEEAGATSITLVGGPLAISEDQEAALSENYTVTRIGDADDNRYETAAKVIAEGDAEGASNTALIATGENFPDALASGPVSYAGRHPLGIVKTNDVPQSVLDSLKAAGVDTALVIGGPMAVGPEVVAELEANNIDVAERIDDSDFGGTGRDATAAAVAEYAVENLNFTNEAANVATGEPELDGADALSGGPLAGQDARPILITQRTDNPGSATDYLRNHACTLTEGIIYGGFLAVSEGAEAEMEAAARDCAAAGQTERPELVNAEIVSTTTPSQQTPSNPAGTIVRYSFDEAVLETGAPPRDAAFHVYTAEGVASTGTVVDVDGNDVTVRFSAVDTAEEAAALTVATVDRNAVTDADGDVNPEGDAAIGETTGGGSTSLPAGVTDAPDLVSVSGFRQGAETGQTAVDFTFDEPAFVTGEGTFSLILTAGDNGVPNDNQLDCAAPAPGTPVTDTPSGGTVVGGNGTTTITVICEAAGDEILTADDVARGSVASGTVSDEQQDADSGTAATGNTNVLQIAEVSNGGNTDEPDLVSVDLRASTNGSNGGVDSALFTFDMPATTATAANFFLYTNEGEERVGTNARVNSADGRQVLVDFADGVAGVVGGSVVDSAIVSGPSATNLTADANEQDEVGVAGSTAPVPGQTAGRTAGPDLTAVSVARGASDEFGNPGDFQATYTFDEAVETATSEVDFLLYLADGTRLVATGDSCVRGADTAGDDRNDNTVTCTDYLVAEAAGTPAATSDQVGSAVLGTVDDGAVTDGTNTNPEGAEAVS